MNNECLRVTVEKNLQTLFFLISSMVSNWTKIFEMSELAVVDADSDKKSDIVVENSGASKAGVLYLNSIENLFKFL
jgi:hypothetical protein